METPGHTHTAKVVYWETARASVLPHASPVTCSAELQFPAIHVGAILDKAEISQLNCEVIWCCHLQHKKTSSSELQTKKWHMEAIRRESKDTWKSGFAVTFLNLLLPSLSVTFPRSLSLSPGIGIWMVSCPWCSW